MYSIVDFETCGRTGIVCVGTSVLLWIETGSEVAQPLIAALVVTASLLTLNDHAKTDKKSYNT